MLGNASNFTVFMHTINILLLLLMIITDRNRIKNLEDKIDELVERKEK